MDGQQVIQRTVAENYIAALQDCGIKYVFCNAGTDFAPLIEGLARSNLSNAPKPDFMVVPHENVAASMAQGYYEISGEMAAVMVHVTVGTANTLCALMNASRENIPFLLAAGRTPITEHGSIASRNGYIHWGQESFDQGGMVREYVKWDYELRHGQPVEAVVNRALDIAMSEPRGPVYLTLPREVLSEEAMQNGVSRRGRPLGAPPAAPSGDAIERAADLIAASENPLIVTGATPRPAGLFKSLAALAKDFAIPVVQVQRQTIASDHEMALGAPTKPVLEAADLVIVIDAPTPWIPRMVAPKANAKLIQIASDPNYSRFPFRGYEADVLVTGSSLEAVPMLRKALKSKLKNKASVVDRRRKRVEKQRAEIVAARKKMLKDVRSSVPIHPAWAAHCLSEVKDKDAIIVNELGVPFDHLELTKPASFVGTSDAGGLGKALGAALGAKLAAPDRQVITCCGDGSYMFGVPSAAHFVGRSQNLPTLTMVSNNAQWLAVRGSTLSVFPDGRAAQANTMPLTELTPSPDYEKFITACEGEGERVEDPEALTGAIERSLKKVDGGTSVLLNVIMKATR